MAWIGAIVCRTRKDIVIATVSGATEKATMAKARRAARLAGCLKTEITVRKDLRLNGAKKRKR